MSQNIMNLAQLKTSKSGVKRGVGVRVRKHDFCYRVGIELVQVVITDKRENKRGKIVVLSIIWNFMWNNTHYMIMRWSDNMLPNSVLDLIEMYVFTK